MLNNYSKVIFGSMRMNEYDFTDEYWINLFEQLHNKGISIHHVSAEYETYERYLKILFQFKSIFPEKKINHVVKLADPHFTDLNFSKERFLTKVKRYLSDLGTESLYGIQWMWRADPQNIGKRNLRYTEQSYVIHSCVNRLKQEGKLRYFFVFPYDIEFAKLTLNIEKVSSNFYDGFMVYRNINEQKFDPILDVNLKHNLVIRPLGAGKLLKKESPADAFSFALNHPNVFGAVTSISSSEKIDQLFSK